MWVSATVLPWIVVIVPLASRNLWKMSCLSVFGRTKSWIRLNKDSNLAKGGSFVTRKVISIVIKEENRRRIILEPYSIDSLALVSQDSKPCRQTKELSHTETLSLGVDNMDNLWCTFCKKLRHTKERYWELHDKCNISSKEWRYKITP